MWYHGRDSSYSNTTRITYPDGYFVDRAFDQLNRLSTITLNGAGSAAAIFGYNQLSQRTSLTFSSGASITYAVQLNGDLTSLVNTFVGSSLTHSYAFNKVHQITSDVSSDSTYDWHPIVGGTTLYAAASSSNEYPQVGASSYSYNTNACLTNDGIWTHAYNSENHLLTSTKAGTSLTFSYDPFHRQSQKSVTTGGTTKSRYLYSGWRRLADYNGTTDVLENRYVYGTKLDEPLIQISNLGVVTFLHANHQRSIVAKVTAAGAVSNIYNYGPFGETASLVGTTFGFNGQRFDSETSLYYYKRRFYSPSIGRFLQPDPSGYHIDVACGCTCSGGCNDDARPSDLNPYSYVMNDPVNNIDSLGLFAASAGAVATPTKPVTGKPPGNPGNPPPGGGGGDDDDPPPQTDEETNDCLRDAVQGLMDCLANAPVDVCPEVLAAYLAGCTAKFLYKTLVCLGQAGPVDNSDNLPPDDDDDDDTEN